MVSGENVLLVVSAMAYHLTTMARDSTGQPTLGHQLWWHILAARMVTVCKHSSVLVWWLLLLSLVVC
jgi:hypothetical protein